MDHIELHDGFVGQGCSDAPQPAVSIGAGAVWLHAYAAVAKAGRYVQGGGCTHGGRGRPDPERRLRQLLQALRHGRGSLIEAEVVTADGAVRIANACTNPDLFWALKGGGGGSFGVVTRLVLRTHELPPVLRRRLCRREGQFRCGVPEADRALRRLLSRCAVQPAVGRAGEVPRRQRLRASPWSSRTSTALRRDSGVAAVPVLDHRARRRFHLRHGAAVLRAARAASVECRLSEGRTRRTSS